MKKIYYALLIIVVVICFLVVYLAIENQPSKILPGLWLGNYQASQNEKFIIGKNISLIVNCSKNLPFKTIPGVKQLRVPVNDTDKEQDKEIMFEYFPSTFTSIKNEIERGGNVLVHCRAGVQRSATLVLCYLAPLFESLDLARDYLRSKRAIVFLPWNNFKKCQKEWYNSKNSSTI